MLIGHSVALSALKKQMEQKMNENKMRSKELQAELSKLNVAFNKEPHIKGEAPTEKMVALVQSIRTINENMEQLEQETTRLIRQLDDANQSKDEEQLIYLSLSELLAFGIAPAQVN